jgi:hypothetical protein
MREIRAQSRAATQNLQDMISQMKAKSGRSPRLMRT